MGGNSLLAVKPFRQLELNSPFYYSPHYLGAQCVRHSGMKGEGVGSGLWTKLGGSHPVDSFPSNPNPGEANTFQS